ncbi:MAG: bifunctional (p)ppGpp synthetase/guanosine-3',5'-bis(diphosphate) 3'-pyrophosphohydrolase [Gallionellaceae bacterium]|jgi:GTP pyrophosphokinase|nr:bifunctional (p)ppGpp synthetase/guanosine-3',5'-bis(diphosphate) 3'-pyrophosphohydrolase [Gallionellaceae bacterium]
MVSVQQKFPPLSGADDADIRRWLETLSGQYAPEETALIRRACECAAPLYHGKTSLAAMPLLQHALGAAAILAGLRMDHETIAAAILHAAPNYLQGDARAWLTEQFGASIAALVDGIARMEHVRQFSETNTLGDAMNKEESAQQIESLRKMLLAMVEDARVVLIKLAERAQTMRSLAHVAPYLQARIARETQSIFAPLANRLGVWQIKWELEDLSVRYTEPELYRRIANLLDERRLDREHYIEKVQDTLRESLARAGIAADVQGRAKHIYSIIAKMRRKKIDFGDLYDVRAVRILVDDVEQCYAALSVVHELWPPIQEEYDDYIANPKPNGYRSLHTAVTGPRGLSLEVQIRTRQMHHDSELGVAAHWRYKENRRSEPGLDQKITWLRQILAWQSELADSGEMREQFRDELLQDRVYVLTPQGKVIDLPNGATPVDFAYVLHTDLGHRTRGAKINGSIVPLNTPLQTGQRVEILTVKQGGPSRDWLSPQQGYLKSPRARAKVRQWFKAQNLDVSIAEGRALLDRELHRLGVTDVNQEKVAQRLNFNKLDELLAAMGRSEITSRRLASAIQQELPTREIMPRAIPKRTGAPRASASGVLIEGVDNLTVRMAKCCKPQAPAPIVGYVTRLGITVHCRDCAYVQRVPQNRRDRLLAAEWSVPRIGLSGG